MKDRCLQKVKRFLKRYLKNDRPLLVAVSGGPDSMALLNLLIAAKQFFSLDLHVAHLDHGLRDESFLEAQTLKAKIELPFYTTRLEQLPAGNLEDRCREKRYEFFKQILDKIEGQAVVTAHHMDDLAETVLKRVLEGAALTKLGGLLPVSKRFGMPIWRPLLDIRKDELSSHGFQDPMNFDPKYLRARMRQSIIPGLERDFGKKIQRSLFRIAKRSAGLNAYLDRKIQPLIDAFVDGKIDFTPFFPLEKVEICHFFQKIGPTMSATELETLYDLIEKRAHASKVLVDTIEFRCHMGIMSVDNIESICYGAL